VREGGGGEPYGYKVRAVKDKRPGPWKVALARLSARPVPTRSGLRRRPLALATLLCQLLASYSIAPVAGCVIRNRPRISE
jgi:hypothetical protein